MNTNTNNNKLKLNKYEQEQLINLLTKWFESAEFNKRNFLNADNVCKLIKDKLNEIGHWKGKPRGSRNNLENLNKGKIDKKKLQDDLNSILRCECGEKIIKSGKMFMCGNICCNKSDQNVK